MVGNDEIEADLTSIFSRLRNSEQYWTKPRNDLNCMTMYYGSATWFTLSPSEWTWEEMGDYLRKINPCLKDLSISALIARDPVSVCRYMENAHKAFIDFILSPDNPIGDITFVDGNIKGMVYSISTLPCGLKMPQLLGKTPTRRLPNS